MHAITHLGNIVEHIQIESSIQLFKNTIPNVMALIAKLYVFYYTKDWCYVGHPGLKYKILIDQKKKFLWSKFTLYLLVAKLYVNSNQAIISDCSVVLHEGNWETEVFQV